MKTNKSIFASKANPYFVSNNEWIVGIKNVLLKRPVIKITMTAHVAHGEKRLIISQYIFHLLSSLRNRRIIDDKPPIHNEAANKCKKSITTAISLNFKPYA
ncbi:Uncharacterised protein [Streptococcus pneumoniae]|nr:Uncharacterised protein [Streptococcus pneumoniae]CJB61499.1 Uncharacterised protein [Streptococcus pneumoniae]CJJ11478.1 Uncharacterised protein [Streptococcus pneumoniae]CKI53591.1 Uncharacterised protein [Streptococcus pneumoniae]